MKKTERKSILPKLVVILLMVMLVSTSLLSRTLAKYVSTGTLVDEKARVAKWGVEITPASDSLFAASYNADDTSYTGDTVIASITGDLVVAPGTSGSVANFAITGTPEVASRLSITDNGSALDGWFDEVNDVYEPVLWYLSEDGGATFTANGVSFAELLSTLEGFHLDFEPNTNLATEGITLSIGWEWPFDSGKDVNDTYLGDLSVPPTITIDFDVTLTQID